MAEQSGWSEENSRSYIEYARYYVPRQAEQIRAIVDLIPDPGEPFQILELACGPGLLAGALLERFPTCTVTGLDGSDTMLQEAARNLGNFGSRFHPGKFNLAAEDWQTGKPTYQAVVSSLAVHHLHGEEKARLFVQVAKMLRPGGAFLIADVIQPANQLALSYAAQAYDAIVRRQAQEIDGSLGVFEQFQRDEWNLFRYPDDDTDHPSPLFSQLTWLSEAGFDPVDVFWMQAGHAIFGGFLPLR